MQQGLFAPKRPEVDRDAVATMAALGKHMLIPTLCDMRVNTRNGTLEVVKH